VRAFLVFLLVLGAAAVGADRVAEHVATDAAESRLEARGVSDPQVDVAGFPFVTQLLDRRFGEVHVTGRALELDGGRAERVSRTGLDVDAPPGGDVTVGQLRGQGLVTYDEVLARAGLDGVRIEPVRGRADRVRLISTVEVLNQPLDVAAVSRVQARGREVRVVPQRFELADGGSVGGAVAAQLGDRLTVTYELRELPDGLEVRSARATDQGFVVTVTGSDVVGADLG